ncbi:MAG: hypothetical protein ABIL58_05995 [Pseudomonadota bacterium]
MTDKDIMPPIASIDEKNQMMARFMKMIDMPPDKRPPQFHEIKAILLSSAP